MSILYLRNKISRPTDTFYKLPWKNKHAVCLSKFCSCSREKEYNDQVHNDWWYNMGLIYETRSYLTLGCKGALHIHKSGTYMFIDDDLYVYTKSQAL